MRYQTALYPEYNIRDIIQYDYRMNTKLLDGRSLASIIKEDIKVKIDNIKNKKLRLPKLVIFIIGKNDASQVYVAKKLNACKQVGIEATLIELDSNISEEELVLQIDAMNNDNLIDGILVQLPIPIHISNLTVSCAISAKKDVDGFHPYNVGRLAIRSPTLKPCTPKGVIRLLEYNQIKIKSKKVVIIGASNLVGRPLLLEFLLQGATATCCHRLSNDIKSEVMRSDILCCAIGKRGVIEADWVPDKSIVVDIGINRNEKGNLIGDLNHDELIGKVAAITPVPGGIGPMTVAMVLENTLEAYMNNNIKFSAEQ